jgi:hypothetical protein
LNDEISGRNHADENYGQQDQKPKLVPATSRAFNHYEWLSTFWTNWITLKADLVAGISECATSSVRAFTILDGHTAGLSAKSHPKKQCNSVKSFQNCAFLRRLMLDTRRFSRISCAFPAISAFLLYSPLDDWLPQNRI